MTLLILALSLFPLSTITTPDSTAVNQIADDVYVFSEHNTTDDWVDGNTTAILTDEGVVVIDAPSIRLSRQHLATIQSLTDKPVRYLVNTHWHYDHNLGNQVYKNAYPDLEIIATERTKEISDRRNPPLIAQYAGALGETFLSDLEKSFATRKDADGEPLSDYDYGRVVKSVETARLEVPLYKEVQYTAPTLTFGSTLELELGGRKILIKRYGGHTLGDAVIYLPEDEILITGDLVIHPVPYGFRPFFSQWIDTLDELMAMNAKTIVPGHGEVLHSNEYLQLQRDLFADMLEQARNAVAEGMTLEELKEQMNIDEYMDALVHDDPDNQWGLENYFLKPGIDRMFQDAKGEY